MVLSLEQGIQGRKRLLSRLPDLDIEQEGGPLLALLKALEARSRLVE